MGMYKMRENDRQFAGDIPLMVFVVGFLFVLFLLSKYTEIDGLVY